MKLKIMINFDEKTGRVDLTKDNAEMPMLFVAQVMSSLVANILANRRLKA